jgi:hypothetical protein
MKIIASLQGLEDLGVFEDTGRCPVLVYFRLIACKKMRGKPRTFILHSSFFILLLPSAAEESYAVDYAAHRGEDGVETAD